MTLEKPSTGKERGRKGSLKHLREKVEKEKIKQYRKEISQVIEKARNFVNTSWSKISVVTRWLSIPVDILIPDSKRESYKQELIGGINKSEALNTTQNPDFTLSVLLKLLSKNYLFFKEEKGIQKIYEDSKKRIDQGTEKEKETASQFTREVQMNTIDTSIFNIEISSETYKDLENIIYEGNEILVRYKREVKQY